METIRILKNMYFIPEDKQIKSIDSKYLKNGVFREIIHFKNGESVRVLYG